MSVKILIGDCRDILKGLPDEFINCVVTSPPYWGLRDYGIDGQLGMERSLSEYIEVMINVFTEVKRILRSDGTLWLNLGDSYAASPNGRSAADVKLLSNDDRTFRDKPFSTIGGGIKPKDLCGIPWRVAFALQSDGWYLRQDIIWSKPNPMPESIKDRCTKAHEYIFLLSKKPRYYYDANSILEDSCDEVGTHRGGTLYRAATIGNGDPYVSAQNHSGGVNSILSTGKRNKRSVWEIATQPYTDAHFATFPPALIEPCILAGSPKNGTVLDPFGGAGTTGLVADRLGRNAILIELNSNYAKLAESRIYNDAPMFAQVTSDWDSMWQKPFDKPELL